MAHKDILNYLCSKRYGGIFGLFLGPQRTVVLTDLDVINETMAKDEYADRPRFHVLENIRGQRCIR